MKVNGLIFIFSLVIPGIASINANAQVSLKSNTVETALFIPFNASQLVGPSVLADQIKSGKSNVPIIFNIGIVEDIEGAKHIGIIKNPENLAKLKKTIADLPKNTPLVIYCGCCPFTKCPNVRPAFDELKRSGFTDVKILDLPVNLKTNWIAPGYPLASK